MCCVEPCRDYIKYFNYHCIYGEGCQLCSNYISQEEQDLRERLTKNQDADISKTLITTEDAACLEDDDIIWIREIKYVK
jgi:hypothetical protein